MQLLTFQNNIRKVGKGSLTEKTTSSAADLSEQTHIVAYKEGISAADVTKILAHPHGK